MASRRHVLAGHFPDVVERLVDDFRFEARIENDHAHAHGLDGPLHVGQDVLGLCLSGGKLVLAQLVLGDVCPDADPVAVLRQLIPPHHPAAVMGLEHDLLVEFLGTFRRMFPNPFLFTPDGVFDDAGLCEFEKHLAEAAAYPQIGQEIELPPKSVVACDEPVVFVPQHEPVIERVDCRLEPVLRGLGGPLGLDQSGLLGLEFGDVRPDAQHTAVLGRTIAMHDDATVPQRDRRFGFHASFAAANSGVAPFLRRCFTDVEDSAVDGRVQ